MPGVTAKVIGRERFIERLRGILDRTHDARAGFDSAHRVFLDAMTRNFETEGQYLNDRPWAPLSPRYAAWKLRAGYGARILVLTTRLRTGLTTGQGDAIRDVRATEARFGIRGAPAGWLQTGTRKMPARPFITVTNPKFRGDVTRPIWTYVFNGEPGRMHL